MWRIFLVLHTSFLQDQNNNGCMRERGFPKLWSSHCAELHQLLVLRDVSRCVEAGTLKSCRTAYFCQSSTKIKNLHLQLNNIARMHPVQYNQIKFPREVPVPALYSDLKKKKSAYHMYIRCLLGCDVECAVVLKVSSRGPQAEFRVCKTKFGWKFLP